MKQENISLKICVGYHKPSLLLEGNCFVPVWGGKACASAISKDGAGLSEQEQQWMNENCLGDDTGDNISAKNRNYCEATILYWMWKNYEKLGNPDYIGFLQYRRHWLLNKNYLATHSPDFYNMVWNEFFSEDYQYKIGLTEHNLKSLLVDCDGVFCANDTHQTIYEYKVHHHSQNIKYWNKTLEIIRQYWPQYAVAANTYNEGTWHAWSNCFIMKREDFLEYCPFLFDVLAKIDSFACADYLDMTAEQRRVPAYVSETLLGIFWTYLKTQHRRLKSEPLMYIKKPFASIQVLPQHIFPISKNAIPIVFISDRNYLKYTAVAIESIKENSAVDTIYDIIILHDGKIPESLQQRICKMGTQNISIRFFNAQYYIQKYNFKEFFHRRLNLMPYLKLFIHEILIGYDRAVFLDGDLLVFNNIEQLYHQQLSGKLIGAAQDPILIYAQSPYWQYRRGYITSNHKMKDLSTFFNSGVLLLNLRGLRNRKEITNLFINEARFHHKDRFHHDQDVFNFILDSDSYILPQKYNWHYYLKDYLSQIPVHVAEEYIKLIQKNEVVILHYNGDPKPWHSLMSRDWLMDLWWRYARNTPFYEELLCNNLNRCSVPSKTDVNIVKDSSNYLSNRLNYYRCRLLSHLTFGKTKMHYKHKKEQLKKRIG